jgi:CHAT domain-containing protein
LLMDKFYEGLINKEESKSKALMSAMQELKAIPEYSHPYFWGPFFLSGDWR